MDESGSNGESDSNNGDKPPLCHILSQIGHSLYLRE